MEIEREKRSDVPRAGTLWGQDTIEAKPAPEALAEGPIGFVPEEWRLARESDARRAKAIARLERLRTHRRKRLARRSAILVAAVSSLAALVVFVPWAALWQAIASALPAPAPEPSSIDPDRASIDQVIHRLNDAMRTVCFVVGSIGLAVSAFISVRTGSYEPVVKAGLAFIMMLCALGMLSILKQAAGGM